MFRKLSGENDCTMRFNQLASGLAAALLLAGAAYAGDSPIPTGEQQSPINIKPSVAVKGTDKVAIYYPVNCTVTLTNTKNGVIGYSGGNRDLPQSLFLANEWASLQGKVSNCSTPWITLNSKAYNLVQFHFHVPSEHTYNGVKMPMEVHFLHQDPSPDADDCPDPSFTTWATAEHRHHRPVATLAAFINSGNGKEMEKLFTQPMPASGQTIMVEGVNLAALLPPMNSFYTYDGSTASPNLSCNWYEGDKIQQLITGVFPEAVHWILSDSVLSLSRESMAKFGALFPEGNTPRSIKELGSRTLYINRQ